MTTENGRWSMGDDSSYDQEENGDWIDRCSQTEVKTELKKYGLSHNGTEVELRQRLRNFALNGSRREESLQHKSAQIPTKPVMKASCTEIRFVCDTARKWNMAFDGRTDPVDFLERITELKECYGFTDAQMMAAVPETIKGSVLLWYRNNKIFWNNWDNFLEDFRTYFLPQDYYFQLEQDIYRRFQRPGEKGRDYIVAIQTLIRRYGKMTAEEELSRIYQNLLPEYRQYIRRRDVHTLRNLIMEIGEFESLQIAQQPRINHLAAVSISSICRKEVKPVIIPTPSANPVCWQDRRKKSSQQYSQMSFFADPKPCEQTFSSMVRSVNVLSKNESEPEAESAPEPESASEYESEPEIEYESESEIQPQEDAVGEPPVECLYSMQTVECQHIPTELLTDSRKLPVENIITKSSRKLQKKPIILKNEADVRTSQSVSISTAESQSPLYDHTSQQQTCGQTKRKKMASSTTPKSSKKQRPSSPQNRARSSRTPKPSRSPVQPAGAIPVKIPIAPQRPTEQDPSIVNFKRVRKRRNQHRHG